MRCVLCEVCVGRIFSLIFFTPKDKSWSWLIWSGISSGTMKLVRLLVAIDYNIENSEHNLISHIFNKNVDPGGGQTGFNTYNCFHVNKCSMSKSIHRFIYRMTFNLNEVDPERRERHKLMQ